MSRAKVIYSSGIEYKLEEENIKSDLRRNGYVTNFIRWVVQRLHTNRNQSYPGQQNSSHLGLYVKGTSETLAWHCPPNTLCWSTVLAAI